MTSSNRDADRSIVTDSIHGDIHLSARERDVIDTAAFQRLRHLKQLGMGQVTYPNATHSRFAHSLGVLAIMRRVIDVAEKSGNIRLAPAQRVNLRLAALLHDIGHYPYSHLMEQVDRVQLTEEQVASTTGSTVLDTSVPAYPSHERLGTLIVTKQRELVKAIGGTRKAREVAALFARTEAADPQLSKLIHSSLDMDRMDYLLRDTAAAGVPFGRIDINYLLNNLQMSPGGLLGVSAKALPAAEQFLMARFFMHRTVYFHKTTIAIEEACRQLLRRVRDRKRGESGCSYEIPADGSEVEAIVNGGDLGNFTDAYIDRIVQKALADDDPVIRTLATAISSRRPPKLLREVIVFEPRDREYHAGSAFVTNCRHKLEQLAQEFEIPLGQFLLYETPRFGFEKRGASLTAAEARELESESQDELIRVFIPGHPEPKAIVDVDHSLLRLCSNHALQIFRLYVIYEKDNKDDVITTLKDRVRDW